MGSLAVRCYLKKYDRELDGLIVCGCPGKNTMAPLGTALIRMLQTTKDPHSKSRLADSIFANMFDRPFRAENLIHAWICSDRKVVETYNKDPLCNFTFTLNGYESLLWLMRQTYSRMGWRVRNHKLPVLVCIRGIGSLSGRQRKAGTGGRSFEETGICSCFFTSVPGHAS